MKSKKRDKKGLALRRKKMKIKLKKPIQVQKPKKKWKIFLLIFLIGLTAFSLFHTWKLATEWKVEKERQVKIAFVSQYIPRHHAEYVVKYSAMYHVDLLDSLTILLNESSGRQKARSKHNSDGTYDYGYYQINSGNWKYIRFVLSLDKELSKQIDSKSVYGAEFNIWAGNLWISWMIDYFYADQTCLPDDTIHFAVQTYNVGWGAFRNGTSMKSASRYLKKFLVHRRHLKIKWEEFEEKF